MRSHGLSWGKILTQVISLSNQLLQHSLPEIHTLIVLGSGMSGCFAENELEILVDERSLLHGHSGRVALLRDAPSPTLVSLGRRHLYEGYAPHDVTEIIRAAARLGARNLILTNAAGGLDPLFRTGDIMLIEEMITTLVGRWGGMPSSERATGERPAGYHFQSIPSFQSDLSNQIHQGCLERGIQLRHGVYAGVLGPSYETRAEIRMLRRMGASAVGMSTLLEVMEATRLGMRVVGLSLITNVLTDTRRIVLDHLEVVEQSRLAIAEVRVVVEVVRTVL